MSLENEPHILSDIDEEIMGEIETDLIIIEVTNAIIHQVYDILDVRFYRDFCKSTTKVKKQLAALLTEEATNAWVNSIEQAELKLLKSYPHIPLIEYQERNLLFPVKTEMFFQNKLQKLQSLDAFQYELIKQKIIHLQEVVDNDEKFMIEVIELTEILRSARYKTAALLEQRVNQSIQVIMKAIELLDLIRSAAQHDQRNVMWIVQIDKVIEQFLVYLKNFDVEDIKALGELLDGKYMISVGTVLPNTIATYTEKFQVCVVHERGFKKISTGEVIREAKVINVY